MPGAAGLDPAPASRAQHPMRRTLELTSTVYTLAQLHVPDTPQAALAGRSNVGKSTLVNSLAGRRKLAKISSTPGKTRSLNFYRVDPPGYHLADLPGYGYAKRAKSEREHWAQLVGAYVERAPRLLAVAVLLDCRLDPQRLDLELIDYVRGHGLVIIPVLTKADKCKRNEQAKRAAQWRRDLLVEPVLFSGKTGQGREEVLRRIEAALGVEENDEDLGGTGNPTPEDPPENA